MNVSTDVGGTFTDYVLWDDSGITAFKALTTPDASTGILQQLEGHKIDEFSHGTTTAVNAIIQRKGAELVFFTTKGFRDVVHIGRQSRSELYSFVCRKPKLPVRHIVEVDERTLTDGSITKDVNEDELRGLAGNHAGNAEIAVVGFINSYVNPGNERRAGSILSDHFKTVITSHTIRHEIREYERFSTALMEGYTAPIVHDYMKKLGSLGRSFSIMQSNGGKCWPDYIKAVNMVMSGPAGGVAATEALCRKLGIKNAIAYDMGGTSADISAIARGRPLFTDTIDVTGIPIKVLAMDIESIGAGGGSIAWLDDGCSLKVGPQSAGSSPGPACYDRGGREFTVSDANLLTGILGGSISGVALKAGKAREAATPLCTELGMTPEHLNRGVIRIVDANMVAALKKISVGRGYDPRKYTLVSFGGAGPMHACAMAKEAGIKTIIVPPMAGAFSALGIMFAPVRFDYVRTLLAPLEKAEKMIPKVVEAFHRDLKAKLAKRYEKAISRVSLDMRYQGQGHQISVPLCYDISDAFHTKHRTRFGFDMPQNPVEVVNVKMVAELPASDISLPTHKARSPRQRQERKLHLHGTIDVYLRDFHGSTVEGPCIIQDETTTIYVDEGWKAFLDVNDVLHLEVN